MKFSNALTKTACALIALYSVTGTAAALVTKGSQQQPKSVWGNIELYDAKGGLMCTLPVPETKQIFNFSEDNMYCENKRVQSFALKNVASATLIQIYENESCVDVKLHTNFFVKLKTTKQPTTWVDAPIQLYLDIFKTSEAGDQIPNRHIRVDEQWEGGKWTIKSWQEEISCVYIERSQPVE